MSSDVSSLEHKKVPVVKEKVETMNFNHYMYTNKKKSHRRGNGANIVDKHGRQKCNFKCNSVKHFAHDCTGSRSNINS